MHVFWKLYVLRMHLSEIPGTGGELYRYEKQGVGFRIRRLYL
jgi:hypothetical protein